MGCNSRSSRRRVSIAAGGPWPRHRSLTDCSRRGARSTAAKIKHIAIATQDTDQIANFFKQALGLQQVNVANSDLATGYFLTDGYINLTVLKFKNDDAAYSEGAPRYAGLHHFGFKVDNLEEARNHVEDAGATFQPLRGKATGQGMVDVEVKYYLPNEVRIALSEKG